MAYTKLFQRFKARLFSFFMFFNGRLSHTHWEWSGCLNNNIFKCLVLNQTNMSDFCLFEVVGRGGKTQLQVGENLNLLVQSLRVKIKSIQ